MSDNAIISAVAGDERKKKFFSVVNSEYVAGIQNGGDEVTYSATSAFITIDNGQARGSNPNQDVIVVPDYIRFTCVSAPSGNGLRFIWKTDITNRWSSGGTSLTTLAANTYVDTYSNFSRITASAQIHAGALTTGSESSAAVHAFTTIRSTLGAVPAFKGDVITISFNGAGNQATPPVTLGASQLFTSVEPAYLGAGSSLVGHMVIDNATASVGEFKVEVGWQELHHDFNA
jgi:hypothetical protein